MRFILSSSQGPPVFQPKTTFLLCNVGMVQQMSPLIWHIFHNFNRPISVLLEPAYKNPQSSTTVGVLVFTDVTLLTCHCSILKQPSVGKCHSLCSAPTVPWLLSGPACCHFQQSFFFVSCIFPFPSCYSTSLLFPRMVRRYFLSYQPRVITMHQTISELLQQSGGGWNQPPERNCWYVGSGIPAMLEMNWVVTPWRTIYQPLLFGNCRSPVSSGSPYLSIYIWYHRSNGV